VGQAEVPDLQSLTQTNSLQSRIKTVVYEEIPGMKP